MTFLSIDSLLKNGRGDNTPVAWDGCRPLSWNEFRARVERLRRHSQGRRRRVLLTERHPAEFLARLLAVLADGDIAVIPPNFQPETLASFQQLSDGDADSASAIEIYTSGSTGEPKCISKPLSVLEAECRVLESCWGEHAKDATVIATTPHHHIYGLLFRLLWPLCAGRPFDCTVIAEPSALVERLDFFKKTVLVSSPAQLSRLPDLTELASIPHQPQLVFSSGGPLMLQTAQHYLQAWGAAPVEVFGSTESGGVAWRRQTEDARWAPLPGVEVRADEDRALLLRSPFLADGETLRMEDAVEVDTDGRFMLKGRLDRIIKIEEKRLSLPEMEAWLTQHETVSRCAIVPLPLGSRVVVGAVVVPRDIEANLSTRKSITRELQAHLLERFDRVLLPRRWRFAEQLPYNERGKLPVDALVTLLRTPL